jgi:hypothetical protein
MQRDLIAVAVTPHALRLGIEEPMPAFQRGLIDGMKQMGQALRGLHPDLFVVNSAHWVSTFNWYATVQDPHRGVCIADEAPTSLRKAAGIPALPNDSPHYQWDYAALADTPFAFAIWGRARVREEKSSAAFSNNFYPKKPPSALLSSRRWNLTGANPVASEVDARQCSIAHDAALSCALRSHRRMALRSH